MPKRKTRKQRDVERVSTTHLQQEIERRTKLIERRNAIVQELAEIDQEFSRIEKP